MRVTLAIAVLLVAGTGTAAAQDAGPPDAGPTDATPAAAPAPDAAPAPEPEPEPEAKPNPDPAPDWESAPPGDEASGVARKPSRGAKPLLWIPRVIFFVPRWVFTVAAQPVRLAGWAYQRYQISEQYRAIFFNFDGTFGIFPVVNYSTTFGFDAGMRLVHKDLFHKRESVRLSANFGGRFYQSYKAKLDSGDRLGDRTRLFLNLSYERRPRERFFGFGNNDPSERVDGVLIDPLTSDASIDSRYKHRAAKAALGVDVKLAGDIVARVSSTLALRRFEPREGDDNIADIYDTSRLPGFEDNYELFGFTNGVQNVYTELELRYDTRRRTNLYRTRALPATGWLLSGYGGYMKGVDGDPSDFYRYGVDVQRSFDLYDGGRILALRAVVETTGGTDGQIDEIPFTDQSYLGGTKTLRGYNTERFRDRAITVASAEYIYDLVPQFSAYAFVDAGRPFRSLKNFEFEDFRIGYGGGIRAHTPKSFLMRFALASSTDGGLFFNFSFSPTTSRRGRTTSF